MIQKSGRTIHDTYLDLTTMKLSLIYVNLYWFWRKGYYYCVKIEQVRLNKTSLAHMLLILHLPCLATTYSNNPQGKCRREFGSSLLFRRPYSYQSIEPQSGWPWCWQKNKNSSSVANFWIFVFSCWQSILRVEEIVLFGEKSIFKICLIEVESGCFMAIVSDSFM